ncbi:hypothetical protein GCM10011507_04040 [Edaphobacter acidisoli]|uniref:TrbI/VirB10 family protein n=1 Tax=Edaphobacter acidisoli TaxID=2040573 RepID=A0A916RGV7_9BACT|nr:hypothetical protein [Edaphobacter acidisoli]GGA55932.1 hypothetical protein GCM10011507_04040 [Edaphobacter acidisoli]
MKIQVAAAAFVVATLPALGYAQMTGVSHPDETDISASQDAAPAPVLTPRTQAKPSAATPAANSAPVVYGPYVPYTGPKAAGTTAAATTSDYQNADEALPDGSADGKIVTSAPDVPGELSEGTLLQTRMLAGLSTATTQPGQRFTAEVMAPVEKDGRVIVPIGAILEGQVTDVHTGHRITGPASMHLETRDILLPDGTKYVVHAQLTDTSRSDFNVDGEGTLKRRDNRNQELGILGLTTGGGAAAGAMVGGGVGALVGAGLGAGVSAIMWTKADRQAELPKDVRLTFSLTAPMMITPLANTNSASASATAVAPAQ